MVQPGVETSQIFTQSNHADYRDDQGADVAEKRGRRDTDGLRKIHNAKAASMIATAVFGIIAGRPGSAVVSVSTSNIQPARAISPIAPLERLTTAGTGLTFL